MAYSIGDVADSAVHQILSVAFMCLAALCYMAFVLISTRRVFVRSLAAERSTVPGTAEIGVGPLHAGRPASFRYASGKWRARRGSGNNPWGAPHRSKWSRSLRR